MVPLNENLYEFGFCPEAKFDYLASLADPEDWGPGLGVLKNYCTRIFQRAVQLDARCSDVDVSARGSHLAVRRWDDGQYACFDTGLYTSRFESIYALFVPNDVPDKQCWYLKGFFKESDDALRIVTELPDRVSFVDNPVDLIYDFRLPIRTNVDHILGDSRNYERIPEKMRMLGNVAVRRLFRGAIKEAEDRASANYTLAVPQYYNGKIQLLLPISLDGDEPDLALAIQREEGYYSARTCLTIEMAYNNARLIVRPEASWIVP